MMKYCESTYQTKRRKTRTVMVGNVGVGSDYPVRVQSMTTSDTRDVKATVEQIIKLADAGCEIARMTVQGNKEAEACEQIKNTLLKKGYTIPLVADIHFYPPAAMKVIDFVEKVRVNPGNYVDKRASFKVIEYDDVTYAKELEKIEEKFTPLINKCKKLKKAMRIGTNHGSLSDRIMNRYGDTPRGMVESAFEFARLCRQNDFHDFIFSMKSSNPLVMIQAYRLLAAEMYKLHWDYPLHLGVTEAGEGEDGRVKSAMGIGSLLLDGLGDTIRVSLTEDPWYEIDPCRELVNYADEYLNQGIDYFEEKHRNFEEIVPRKIQRSSQLPLHPDGTVISDGELKDIQTIDEAFLSTMTKKFAITTSVQPKIILIEDQKNWESIKDIKPDLIIFNPKESRLHFARKFFDWLKENEIEVPVILKFSYSHEKVIRASAECGALLCDRLGDGLWLDDKDLSFGILQAARMRTTKTEYISCPSCGRTLFELQDVTRRIREKTSHLVGVKIAIMGCIVNGPGEMADADFGYVGSRPGKVDLYVGKECVEKNIDFSDADERLIDLIKKHGKWVSPYFSQDLLTSSEID